MADKSIEQLAAANAVQSTDLFVLQQSGTAKKLTGQTLENWLLAMADGHGGIQSIKKVSTSGLVDTYRITLSDTTTTTFTVTNGAKGDKGNQTYVHIKWAATENPADYDLSDIPDAYIGISTATTSTAPTSASAYKWYHYKGETGDTGAPATLVSKAIQYMAADRGDVIPSGSWLDRIPVVEMGRYLWTRTTLVFNTGDPVVSYSVGRMGIDGAGTVSTINNIAPDPNGNIEFHPENLLDNPWFTINQRGTTVYTVGEYGVDRWKLASGTATVTDNGIRLNGTLRQILEISVDSEVTASVKMYSGSATATYDDSTRYFDIVSNGGTIRAAKLEFGRTSTIDYDSKPDYRLELLKCMTHFFRLDAGSNDNVGYGVGVATNTHQAQIEIPMRVRMRQVPSILFSNPSNFQLYPVNSSVTAVEIASAGLNDVRLRITIDGTLTNGSAQILRTVKDAPNTYIDFVADI